MIKRINKQKKKENRKKYIKEDRKKCEERNR